MGRSVSLGSLWGSLLFRLSGLGSSAAGQGRRGRADREEGQQLWDCGRLASGCCGGAGLTTPGNGQRKPPGRAPRATGGVGPAQDIFSRVLGRLLALSRPPGSPSISPTEWRGWAGGVDLFPGFGTSHPPCPPPSSWPENNGASPHRPSWDSRCGRGWMATGPTAPSLRLLGTGSLDCSFCFQTAA